MRRPSKDESMLAVAALEEILQLPERTLTSLLAPGEGTVAAGRRRDTSFDDLVEEFEALDRLIGRLGHDLGNRDDPLMMLERLRIGPAGDIAARHIVNVARANHESDRQVIIAFGEPGCRVEDVAVHAVSGCRIGRVLRDDQQALVIAELLYDRLLRIGETHVVEYEITDDSGLLSSEYSRFTRSAVRQYVLQVTFDPSRLPVRCARFTQQGRNSPRTGLRDLRLDGDRAVHVVEGDTTPGLYGIAWEWD